MDRSGTMRQEEETFNTRGRGMWGAPEARTLAGTVKVANQSAGKLAPFIAPGYLDAH